MFNVTAMFEQRLFCKITKFISRDDVTWHKIDTNLTKNKLTRANQNLGQEKSRESPN